MVCLVHLDIVIWTISNTPNTLHRSWREGEGVREGERERKEGEKERERESEDGRGRENFKSTQCDGRVN